MQWAAWAQTARSWHSTIDTVSADLFISYAWTSDGHREWVRLLAAQMKAIGYDVLIDADVDYGDDLTGFMQRATDSCHVLLIVDENYLVRADQRPDSGVGIENRHISEVYGSKPASWLSVLFKDNEHHRLPAWFGGTNPRGHSFNANPQVGHFPGSEQIVELWRWIEDLPANRDHEVTAALQRERCRRLETIDRQRDLASWSNPALEGEVHFLYDQSPGKTFTVGYGEYCFRLQFSAHDASSIYIYRDPIHAVGINRSGVAETDELAAQLTPGRTAVAAVGEQMILQNAAGALCLVDLLAVQVETITPTYVPASIRFRYRIMTDS